MDNPIAPGTAILSADDMDEASDIARAAVQDEPSRDLSIDEQEQLAEAFLRLRGFVEFVHLVLRDPDLSGADTYEALAEHLDRMGIHESWRGYRVLADHVTREAAERGE